MTELEWKKYARYLPPSGVAICPICGKEITEGESDVEYSKTVVVHIYSSIVDVFIKEVIRNEWII